MINGMHAIVFSPEAEKVRDFFADVIGLSSVDAGGGWLIFALPPAELAVHPADGESRHQLYLMCDDIGATLAELRARGAEIALGPGGRHPPARRHRVSHLPAPAPFAPLIPV
jgi:catechol 2,3-dioxygenase-like lactoylglutathione lyase family enzyme